MKTLDLFSGIGGFSLGLERVGFTTEAFCEIHPYARKVIHKHWPSKPCHKDVKSLTIEAGEYDVICGGFPCQDISCSGLGKGLEGARSGLWSEYRRLIKEGEPKYVIIENVAAIRSRGLHRVLQDLWEVGYDAEWNIISASSIGAPHQRERLWIVAYPHSSQLERGCISRRVHEKITNTRYLCWGEDSPGVERTSNGIPSQMDRLRCLGNAVIPQIPELLGGIIKDIEAAGEVNARL